MKRQYGFYVPSDVRNANFFPPLLALSPDRAHIRETELRTFWPTTGEWRISRVVHYLRKGSETHFTGLPKDQFAGLTPASLLLMGAFDLPDGLAHWILIVDSASEAAAIVESVFDLGSDFHTGLFLPADYLLRARDEYSQLIEELSHALAQGTLPAFIASAALPSTDALAQMAQTQFMRGRRLSSLSPFALAAPGDAVMTISRDIEYALYRQAEMRHRAAEVLRILTGQGGGVDIATAVVRGFGALDATFLSASQHRKSRAGMSFEHHIRRLLEDGNIRYEAQAVTGGRRPDFVMPTSASLANNAAEHHVSMVLSAKTTLRERWKQIALERFASPIFLATVDDRISDEAIRDMSGHNICLVVPESLKESDYDVHPNVITFGDFFRYEVGQKRPTLLAAPAFRLT
ncbi:EcoRII [Lysobacter soli]|nr:EcoRII [Lysobacter soli]